jgi:hypothetical protein
MKRPRSQRTVNTDDLETLIQTIEAQYAAVNDLLAVARLTLNHPLPDDLQAQIQQAVSKYDGAFDELFRQGDDDPF